MIIDYSQIKTPEQSKQIAFEMFASVHPHESYDFDRPRFLAFVKKQAPHLNDDDILAILKETDPSWSPAP